MQQVRTFRTTAENMMDSGTSGGGLLLQVFPSCCPPTFIIPATALSAWKYQQPIFEQRMLQFLLSSKIPPLHIEEVVWLSGNNAKTELFTPSKQLLP